jgi:flagellin-specific chaperone FliS
MTTMTLKGRQYLEEQITAMSPIELVVKLYDIAIASCRQRDRNRLSKVLVELISALNFDHREISLGLFKIYNHCMRLAKEGDFDAVQPILAELRDAWSQAAQSQAAAQPA